MRGKGQYLPFRFLARDFWETSKLGKIKEFLENEFVYWGEKVHVACELASKFWLRKRTVLIEIVKLKQVRRVRGSPYFWSSGYAIEKDRY